MLIAARWFTSASRQAYRRVRLAIAETARVVALLPGSRTAEIRRHLPILLGAAGQILEAEPKVTLLLGLSETIDQQAVAAAAAHAGVPVRVIHGRTPEVMRAADFLLAVSGTVTLEAAILGTPMLITYRVSPVSGWLLRMLIRVRFAGLPNLIAGKAIVPELLQRDATPERLAATALEIMRSAPRQAAMRDALADVRRRLGNPGAVERAAREVLMLLPEPPVSDPSP
jgi:lipid-A-disaccharide synthase